MTVARLAAALHHWTHTTAGDLSIASVVAATVIVAAHEISAR